jgi:hypothetical protein
MSAYKGHRGPNVSQYIANLNQLSPQQDLLADPAPVEDFSDFLNADFYDINNVRNASVDFDSPADFAFGVDNEQTQPLKSDGKLPRNPSITSADPNMEFMNGKHLLAFAFQIARPLSVSRVVFRTLWPMGTWQGACKPRYVCRMHRHPTLVHQPLTGRALCSACR